MPDSVTGDESSPLLCHLSPSEPVFLACRAPCVSFSPLSSPPLFSTHPSLAVSKYRGSQTWALCQHVQIYYQAASKGRGQAPVSRHGAGHWGCRTCVRCCPFPQSTHQCPYAAAEVSETWPGSSAIISMSFRPFKRTFSSSLLLLVALPGSKGRMGLISCQDKEEPKDFRVLGKVIGSRPAASASPGPLLACVTGPRHSGRRTASPCLRRQCRLRFLELVSTGTLVSDTKCCRVSKFRN